MQRLNCELVFLWISFPSPNQNSLYGLLNVESHLSPVGTLFIAGHPPEHSTAEKQQVIPGDRMLSTVVKANPPILRTSLGSASR